MYLTPPHQRFLAAFSNTLCLAVLPVAWPCNQFSIFIQANIKVHKPKLSTSLLLYECIFLKISKYLTKEICIRPTKFGKASVLMFKNSHRNSAITGNADSHVAQRINILAHTSILQNNFKVKILFNT